MNEEPSAPETDKLQAEATEPAKSSVNLPTSVLALGFIAIALVGVLIATAIRAPTLGSPNGRRSNRSVLCI